MVQTEGKSRWLMADSRQKEARADSEWLMADSTQKDIPAFFCDRPQLSAILLFFPALRYQLLFPAISYKPYAISFSMLL